MRKTLFGLLLCGTSLLVQQFFNHYHGHLIPFPRFFAITSILLIPLSIMFIFYGWQDIEKTKKEKLKKAVRELRNRGEKIVVEYEKCSFGSEDSPEEIKPPDFSSGMDESLRGLPAKTEIRKSMVIYHYNNGSRIENFPSPVFPIDSDLLQKHIIKKDLILYLDRKDHSKFFFDLHDEDLAEMDNEYPS